MNRRLFLGAASAIVGALTLGSKPNDEVREVMFSPPGEPPAIHWTKGHMDSERVALLFSGASEVKPFPVGQVRYGWGTRKLSHIIMYLSDTPQEGFEPITYWIPADYAGAEVTT